MLAKMGWKGDGSGLGKTQQGTSTHLRAVRRAESLGIGAENDAFGEKGWQDTNAGFHGVLANLKREYSSIGGSSNSSDRNSESDVDEGTRQKKKKKIRKADEKKQSNGERSMKMNKTDGTRDKTSGSKVTTNGLRLPQNKVQAGHARKMREAKDIRNKSAEDMAAIFGVKADFYRKPRDWISEEGESGNRSRNISGGAGSSSSKDQDSSSGAVEKKEKRKKRKSQMKAKVGSDTCSSDNNTSIRENFKEDKKKRKQLKEDDDDITSPDREEKWENKSKR